MKIFLEKIKHWLKPGKQCRQFCPTCEYYDLCKAELTAREETEDGKARLNK